MTKLIDPDDLNRATEYQYDTTVPATRTVELFAAGNLNDTAPGFTSGVTGQCLYSRMILDYAAATGAGTALRKHKFPLSMRTESDGTWNVSWGPAGTLTRELLRDFGWAENGGAQYACFAQLDLMNADTDQSTYQWVSGGTQTVTDFDKAGRLNEALLVTSGGTFLQLRQRTQGKQHAEFEVTSRLGITPLQGRLYSVLLGNAVDPNIVETDGNIDTLTPYTNMSIDYLIGDHEGIVTWTVATPYVADDLVIIPSGAYAGRYLRCTVGGTSHASVVPTGPGTDGTVTWEADPGERQIGANYYHFSRIIDAATGTVIQAQNYGQRQLRQLTDINDDINLDAFGAVNGVNAAELFNLPSALEGAKLLYGYGVFADNVNGADLNNQRYFPHFVDGAKHTGTDATGRIENPFKANLKVICDADLVGGICTVFFTNDDAGDNTGRDFDTDNAIVVQDDSLTDIDFTIATAETDFTYDYDGNVQRGAASAGTPAPVTAHALRAGVAIPITAVATITAVDNIDLRISALADTVFNNP